MGTFYLPYEPMRANLQGMDDYDFESLVGEILGRLGFGEVYHLPRGPDEGKDLIVTKGKRKIYVECKHRPDTNVGIKMIRDLHSPSQTDGVTSSIFVTTGGYTPHAVRYAKKVRPPMRLIDGNELTAMASRAKITLVWGPRPENKHPYVYLPSDPAAWEFLEAHLDTITKAYWPWDSQMDTKSPMSYMPYYRVDYSVPRNVHRKKAGRATVCVLVNGSIMKLMPDYPTYAANVLSGPMVDACFSVATSTMIEWNSWMDREPHLEFALPEEEVRLFAVKEARMIAGRLGLPSTQVRLKAINRVMVPWYQMKRETRYAKATATALYGKHPFIVTLSKG